MAVLKHKFKANEANSLMEAALDPDMTREDIVLMLKKMEDEQGAA